MSVEPLSSRQSNTESIGFELLRDSTTTWARRGKLTTCHGVVETPAFMPVGTQAAVKTLHPDEVWATGARIVLANTYHLMLRPGAEVIRAAGGIQRFMSWSGPVLTDSGGFQVFSLAQQAKVSETGVVFRSHLDGSRHELSPERAVELQVQYGADILMALDHFVGLPADRRRVAESTARTQRWLSRCVDAFHRLDGPARGAGLFGICQGGMDEELRAESARFVGDSDVSGCAIGGLSVGEPKPVMAAMIEAAVPYLPPGKPRYLMGVGSPEDLWESVARGVDLFDCVLPTRIARNGSLFTADERIDIRQSRWRDVHEPIEVTCDCGTCHRFTAAYVHHLFRAREILGLRLASVHNLRFLARQMETMRWAIETDQFDEMWTRFRDRYRPVAPRNG